MIDSGKSLTAKQRRFCEEYLLDFNATKAAVRAGYSPRSAKQQGSRLLTNADLGDYLAEQIRKRSEHTHISSEEIIRDLRLIVDRCLDVRPVFDSAGRPRGRFRFEPNSAIKALELLGKHLGMFTGVLNRQDVPMKLSDLTGDELDAEIDRLERKLRELDRIPPE